MRERVALIDQTSFSKFELVGRGRGAVPAAPGRLQHGPAGRQRHLHPAVQRARRHRVRPHLHPPRARPLLLRDRRRLRQARCALDPEPPAPRRLGAADRRDVGARRHQPVRPQGARGAGGRWRRKMSPTPPSRSPPCARSRSARRRCAPSASAMSASWAGNCTCRPSMPRMSTSCCARRARRTASPMSAIARSIPCAWKRAISTGPATSRRTTRRWRPGSASASTSTRAISSAATSC